jgi:hypothetical protein
MERSGAGGSLTRALVVLAALAPGFAGCQRKAPGPDECVSFARASYGLRPTGKLRPAEKQKVDELIRECLLTPFDRELVQCTLEGGSPRACMRAFARRHDSLERKGGER